MLRSTISNWREYLTPISHKSTFLSTGQITPEEFVQAGDYLVHMFPTWHWNGDYSVDDLSIRDFLPGEKQFLMSKKVPCVIRAQDFFNVDYDVNFDEEDIDNEPTEPNKHDNNIAKHKSEEIEDIDEMLEGMELTGNEDEDDDDDIIVTKDSNANKKRYYDLYITYSTSYRVPKMYIVGFNAQGTPLKPDEMFEDISMDYRNKTATIEKLPFLKNAVLSVSIHPCKHANVMKILLEKVRTVNQKRRLDENKKEVEIKNKEDDWEDLQDDLNDTLRVDQYLVVFLKFITSVTPTIEHDYTMEGW